MKMLSDYPPFLVKIGIFMEDNQLGQIIQARQAFCESSVKPKGNYLGYFRVPFNLSTDFAWHKIQKGLYALESSKVYSFHFIDCPP